MIIKQRQLSPQEEELRHEVRSLLSEIPMKPQEIQEWLEAPTVEIQHVVSRMLAEFELSLRSCNVLILSSTDQ